MLDINTQYAILAAASNETAYAPTNRQTPPDGWHKISGGLSGQGDLSGDLGHCENKSSGFEAAAYRNGNKIIISYAGTNADDLKEWFTDLEIGAVGTANQQIKDAAAYYQEIKAANPDADIEFTGHSLGGGLAALMGVFFDKPAITFDPAPFRLAAAQHVADKVADYLAENGYPVDADLAAYHTTEQSLVSVGNLGAILLGLDMIGANVYPTTIRGENNVKAFVLNGEFLTDGLDAGLGLVTDTMNSLRIMDSLTIVKTNDAGSGLNLGDYHSINLLTLAMAAPGLTDVAATLQQTFVAIMKDDAAYNRHSDDPTFLVHLLNQSLHHDQYAFLAGFTDDLAGIRDYVQAHAGQPLTDSATWQRLAVDMTIDHYYRHNGSQDVAPALTFDGDTLHFDTGDMTPEAWMNQYISITGGTTMLTNGMIKAFIHDTAALSWHSVLNGGGHTLHGAAEMQNVLLGLNGDDVLLGGAGDDLLIGGYGNDTLHGSGGADIMIGGYGNDIYYVDSADDVVHEVIGQGTDTVLSTVDYHLSHNLENLLLQGDADLIGRGNYHDNILTGNAGDNTLYGGGGNDILTGGAGDDVLQGGVGNDRYIFNLGDGRDVIRDAGTIFDNDGLIFGKGLSFDDLQLTLDSSGLHFRFDGNEQDSVCIADWQRGSGSRIEYCQFDDGHHLALNDIEQLITLI